MIMHSGPIVSISSADGCSEHAFRTCLSQLTSPATSAHAGLAGFASQLRYKRYQRPRTWAGLIGSNLELSVCYSTFQQLSFPIYFEPWDLSYVENPITDR
jgi:hypothetical protein